MELVHFDVDRAIATITLDSPSNRNALSSALIAELSAHLARAADAQEVRAVLLNHTGSTFCAGADVREQFAEGGPSLAAAGAMQVLQQIVALPKPVVVRLDGAVRGGGLGLVGAADIVIAGPRASFAFTEVRLGVAPAMISLTTLSRLTERAAARYLLTGETFDATAAVAAGLVTVAATDVDAEVSTVIEGLRRCSPQSLRVTKPMLTRVVQTLLDEHGDDMQRLSAELFASDEAREGVAAFLEKRSPRWAT
jgi:enoyl-CoA hydratase/carnithine racemase